MEEQKLSLFTEYQPIDYSSIKPIKIYTEKDLENEASNICELLKDIKADWDKRLKSLLIVQQCIVSEEVRNLNNFPQFMAKLVIPLTQQLYDLRSQITKEASKAISLMAEVLQQDFEPLAPKFISKLSLYKLLNSAKHILAEHSHICIIAILNNVIAPRVIPNIYEEVKSKNPQVRIKNAEYIYLIISLYPVDSISNYLGQIEDLLTNLLMDAKSEARQLARFAFFKYKEILPERANSIFLSLDGQNQKAILDDEEFSGAISSPIKYSDNSLKFSSPQKKLQLGNAIQNALSSDILSVGDKKQTRSVSRGRPQTAANNLISKASAISPAMNKLKSPRPAGQENKKSRLFDLELCSSDDLNLDQINPKSTTDLTSKMDLSKLRLLKSPKLSGSQKEQNLTVQTSYNTQQPQMNESLKSYLNQNQDKLGIIEENKAGALVSPRLQSEKQLKNLKEKKVKQENDLVNYSTAPTNNQKRGSIRVVQQPKQNFQIIESQQVLSPLKKASKIIVQKNQEEITKQKAKLLRQKSASPIPSPKSALIKGGQRNSKKEISSFQNSLKMEKQSVSSTNNELGSVKQTPISQKNQQVSQQQKNKLASYNKLQVSQSIQNINYATNPTHSSQSFKSQKRDELDLYKQNIQAFEEQKIFDELDFMNTSENIEQLVISARSQNMNERVRSFNMIQKSEDQLSDCSDQLIKSLFKLHIDYIKDQNWKVAKAAQDSFVVIIQHNKNMVD